MVCVRARKRRDEADPARALDYNVFNASGPCLIEDDAKALIACISEPTARMSAEVRSEGRER